MKAWFDGLAVFSSLLPLPGTKLPEQILLRGLPASVCKLVMLNRPTTWSNPVLDLNFAYRLCLEIARYVFMPVIKDSDYPRAGWDVEIPMFQSYFAFSLPKFYEEEEWKEVYKRELKAKRRCIIATTSGCERKTLIFYRNLRDNFMSRTTIGKYLIELYYTLSPLIISTVLRFDIMRKIMKETLTILKPYRSKKTM